ncbi:Protein DSF2 [Stagonosporopsis vannaccii]|nr:Protein DSF2 [Stagonosporopsis vannaccii]
MVDRPDRPNALGLRSYSHEPPSTNASVASLASASMSNLSLADLPSPRAGDAPPALSPLDQLALQGRLLAKRFEQADKSGRRLSRLAPLTIQNEFGNRSGYFSSLSSTVSSPNEDLPPVSAGGAVAPPAEPSPRQRVSERHRSIHPQISSDDPQYAQSLPARSPLAPIGETSPAAGYFDIPRSRSPDSVEPHIGVREATPVSPSGPTPTSQFFLSPQRKPSSDSMPRSHPRSNLLPPRKASNHSQRSPRLSPSIRSFHDSSDEVDDMPLSGSYDSLPRNRALSPSSSLSRAQSPFTPTTTMPRSPSAASEHSLSGHLPRPAFNFSRPISRQSTRPSIDCVRTSLEMPSRQPSDESVFMRPSCESNLKRENSYTDGPAAHYATDTVHTPVSMASEDFRRSGDYSNNPAPSYIHSTFDLPRGRKLDRKSIGVDDFFKKNITWDQSNGQQRPPSPESPPRSFDKDRSPQAPSLTSSNSTIRAATAATAATAEVTAQQHCDLGIELHEKGELLKSTYHLRLAARGGLPEAMLWYGLACRHGWGMRENKPEALQWLRRAVDSGHLEIADDEQGQSTDIVKKKQHRAQYAVAIYELGKCYMNGWGAAQDKTLALRCYEIAGNWGDPDALVEAGYCYAEGVGCKKDMKKAAKFYRAAEAKGVSMVGNSWIYKDKYNDDATSTSDSRSVRSGRSTKKDNSEKKARDKSRTRTIFGRKKSHTATST